jgi:hypothetical protein
MVRLKEHDAEVPHVVEFQDLDTITGMRHLCQEKIRTAQTLAEKQTYQRLLKTLDMRFRQLRQEKAGKTGP